MPNKSLVLQSSFLSTEQYLHRGQVHILAVHCNLSDLFVFLLREVNSPGGKQTVRYNSYPLAVS